MIRKRDGFRVLVEGLGYVTLDAARAPSETN